MLMSKNMKFTEKQLEGILVEVKTIMMEKSLKQNSFKAERKIRKLVSDKVAAPNWNQVYARVWHPVWVQVRDKTIFNYEAD